MIVEPTKTESPFLEATTVAPNIWLDFSSIGNKDEPFKRSSFPSKAAAQIELYEREEKREGRTFLVEENLHTKILVNFAAINCARFLQSPLGSLGKWGANQKAIFGGRNKCIEPHFKCQYSRVFPASLVPIGKVQGITKSGVGTPVDLHIPRVHIEHCARGNVEAKQKGQRQQKSHCHFPHLYSLQLKLRNWKIFKC